MANGNGTGRGGKLFNDRELAAEVRTLALGQIKKVLKGDDNEFKKAVLLKLTTSILPRLNEHTGRDGEDLFPKPILNVIHKNFSNSEDNGVDQED